MVVTMRVIASQVLAVGSTAGVTNWIEKNLIPLIILVIALGIVAGAQKRDHKGAVTKVGIILLGLMVAGLALGGKSVEVGQWLSSLIFG
jgi:hypothetical protein